MYKSLGYFFNRSGRLSRETWLFRLIALGILCAAFGLLGLRLIGNTGAAFFSSIFLLGFINLSVKRFHDLDTSGKQLLMLLIPVLGPLWVLFRLLKSGSLEDNQFGRSPARNMDYTKVDIHAKKDYSTGLSVNDVTQLNPIEVLGVMVPKSIEELQAILKGTTLPVCVGGGHFSMGGHTASNDSIHIDMRYLNKVTSLNVSAKTIRVQAGIRWCDIQKLIDPHNLSVKIMQTYANFTVGGTLSVNAHGRYMGLGPVILSVRNISLLLANGDILLASPTENSDLFYAAIGGYGAIGIIAEAELNLTDNVRVERKQIKLATKDYLEWFKTNVRSRKDVIFHNADLYPMHLQSARAVSWVQTEKPVTTKYRLQPLRIAYPLEIYFFWAFTETPFGKFRREYIVDPLLYLSKKIHWRNYEAGYDAYELEPLSRENTTYVLQEYFVPFELLPDFIPKVAHILNKHSVNILNISIRHALGDPGSLMAWARGETFAFVLYYKQKTSDLAISNVAIWTRELIEAVLSCSGTYYLPYQLHATYEQFIRAYPNSQEVFRLKHKLDPNYRLRNALWNKYYEPTLRKVNELAHSSLFHRIYDNPQSADRFYYFLKNIFHLYPEGKFHHLIQQLVNKQADDESIYKQIQMTLPEIKPALSLVRYALPALITQKGEMGKQSGELIGKEKALVDYVEIGSTGRYVKTIFKNLNLSGTVTLVNDKAPTNSPADIVERGQFGSIGKFVGLDDYSPLQLPSQSSDLVSCFIGLHHMQTEKLIPFLESIAKIVRKGGFFILRDHDVKDKSMDDFVSLAHCVFNAGLNEPWEVNAKELRHFASIETWIDRVESVGFKHTGVKLTQAGDPSDNILVAFERV